MRKINTGRVGLDSPAQTPEGKKGAGGGLHGTRDFAARQ